MGTEIVSIKAEYEQCKRLTIDPKIQNTPFDSKHFGNGRTKSKRNATRKSRLEQRLIFVVFDKGIGWPFGTRAIV
jgi:hypothetical protein